MKYQQLSERQIFTFKSVKNIYKTKLNKFDTNSSVVNYILF